MATQSIISQMSCQRCGTMFIIPADYYYPDKGYFADYFASEKLLINQSWY